MEKTQLIANDKKAYTQTDRGTFLATKDRDKLEMDIVLEGDPILFNQYGVMAVSPEKYRQAKYKEAKLFIDWLISSEGQKAIGDFKDKLFTPKRQLMGLCLRGQGNYNAMAPSIKKELPAAAGSTYALLLNQALSK